MILTEPADPQNPHQEAAVQVKEEALEQVLAELGEVKQLITEQQQELD